MMVLHTSTYKIYCYSQQEFHYLIRNHMNDEKVNVLKGTSEFSLQWIEWASGSYDKIIV